MNTLRTLAVGAVVLAAACTSSPSAVPSRTEIPAGTPVALAELGGYSRFQSGIGETSRMVVAGDSAWNSVTGRIYGQGAARPSIDFTTETVIVAAMGSRPTGGYGITVERAVRTEGEIVVEVVETSPGRGCMTTQALTAPVHAVRIARQTLPIRFVERKTVRECN
ncbi:MAG TPA: protease complex subunit PrcB family protein [Longimicrobium sp.]|jgi:hypothetical protein|uniref:protease complex subunit PrcB family protein n=1 Tax=Longimicrobium sp. TaxID=2029185 RepID=UPI002ED8F2BB